MEFLWTLKLPKSSTSNCSSSKTQPFFNHWWKPHRLRNYSPLYYTCYPDDQLTPPRNHIIYKHRLSQATRHSWTSMFTSAWFTDILEYQGSCTIGLRHLQLSWIPPPLRAQRIRISDIYKDFADVLAKLKLLGFHHKGFDSALITEVSTISLTQDTYVCCPGTTERGKNV